MLKFRITKFIRPTMIFAFVLLPYTPTVFSAPKLVTTDTVDNVAFFPVRDAPAIVISLNDTRVSSEISGLIQGIAVRVGERVNKGDNIANLDCRDYEIATKQAAAILKSAQAQREFDASQIENARKLRGTKSISEEEFARRSSNFAVSVAEENRLQAALDAAKRSEEKCNLQAPFDAVVIEKIASIGDFVTQGSPVLRLLDLSNIEVSAKVQEQDLDTIQLARDLQFVSRSKNYPLSLRSLLPLMESRIHSYEVRLSFTDLTAPPGNTGRIQWSIPIKHIPVDLVVHKDDLGIFIEENGVARFIPLPKAKEGKPAAIDLPGSTKLIIKGRYTVNDGDTLRLVQP